jgi:hypothetical protein
MANDLNASKQSSIEVRRQVESEEAAYEKMASTLRVVGLYALAVQSPCAHFLKLHASLQTQLCSVSSLVEQRSAQLPNTLPSSLSRQAAVVEDSQRTLSIDSEAGEGGNWDEHDSSSIM